MQVDPTGKRKQSFSVIVATSETSSLWQPPGGFAALSADWHFFPVFTHHPSLKSQSAPEFRVLTGWWLIYFSLFVFSAIVAGVLPLLACLHRPPIASTWLSLTGLAALQTWQEINSCLWQWNKSIMCVKIKYLMYFLLLQQYIDFYYHSR